MKWRFWDPGPHHSVTMISGTLPPREVNLTDLRLIGEELKRLTGADRFVVEVTGNTPRQVEIEELGRLHPSQVSLQISATGHGPYPAQPEPEQMTLVFALSSYSPATLNGVGPSAQNLAASIRSWPGTLGKPVRSRAWRVPVAFFVLLAAVFAPMVVLWSLGDLSMWLIPVTLLFAWVVIRTAAPLLQERVQLERSKTLGWVIDFRPIEDVRLDREQQRQRRQTGLRYALITGLTVAVVAAVLAAVLRHYFP